MSKLVRLVAVLASFAAALAAAQPLDPTQGPGGPILVLTSPANPYTVYYAEILRAEGLNAFAVASIDDLDADLLAGRSAVILGEMELAADDVALLASWVEAGGTLVAMRPDRGRPELLALLGLADAGGSLDWPGRRYLRFAPGAGLVAETIQYHGPADLYHLAGAASLATLYGDADTPTAHPAATVREVGAGRAAAFTYDLARSVVLTRQGNPAWSRQDRDGDGRVRSNDAFVGDTPGVDDWIDLARVAIPQADEQQRLLANLLVSGSVPLPRFWYFPDGFKAVVVMTMDSHGGAGYTLARMDEHLAQSPGDCSVDDWECVRATNYLFANDAITPEQALAYDALGFEFALHVDTGCDSPWPDLAALRAIYDAQHANFVAAYPGLPPSLSERGHCVTWADWDSKPIAQLEKGVRLDCTYYYENVGPWQIDAHPGLYTGSGLPMRFARLDGSLIDVFQATTQMTDESGQSYPHTASALLDRAVGPEGYYAVLCANMHSDNGPPWIGSLAAPQIVAEAQARGVPVVSARQMLAWLDARGAASFQEVTFAEGAHTLSFTVAEDAGALTLEGMVPYVAAQGVLSGLTRDGAPATFRRETVKGVEYALFAADAGAYVATYDPDEEPPVITFLGCAVQQGGTAEIAWTTDEPATARVEYGLAPDALDQQAEAAGLATDHAITLTGLDHATTYHYRLRSADVWGNEAVHPASGALSFTTPPPVCLEDDLAADFAAGAWDEGIAIVESGGGAVTLAPDALAEFGGDALPPGWTWVAADPGGAAVVADGRLALDGARAHPEAVFAQPPEGEARVLEFTATFASAIHQHGGFGFTLQEYPYAVFSTASGGDALYVHTRRDGTVGIQASLGTALLGGEHRFRIEWRAAAVDYFVDGAPVAHHDVALGTDLRPVFFDRLTGGPALAVDDVVLTPHAAAGEYVSAVHGLGAPAAWGLITWAADVPAGAALDVAVRTGDTPAPDATWSPFTPMASGDVLGVTSQFLQYRAALATTDPAVTPRLLSLAVACAEGEDAVPPFITDLTATPHPGGASATIAWTTNEPATSRVDFGLSPGSLPWSATAPDLTTHHEVELTGLAPAITYHFVVTSTDALGNAATAPSPPGSFVTPVPVCALDDAWADFAAGAHEGTYVADDAGGEVILAPAAGAEFVGDALPDGWEWALRPGSVGGCEVAGGVLTLQGAWAGTTALLPAGRAVDFTATFTGGAQHAGFGLTLGGADFAIFTCDGSIVQARTLGPLGNTTTSLGTAPLHAPHAYRIVWSADSIEYWYDGALVATHAAAFTHDLRFIAMDGNDGGPVLVVDAVRVGPFAAAGAFTSRVFDAGADARWLTADWEAAVPPGTTLAVSVRAGETPQPDDTWTGFLPVSDGGVLGLLGRHAQYRADLATSDPALTPALASLGLTCTSCAQAPAPVAGLAAASVVDGDTPGATLDVALAWTPPPPGVTVVLYRKGFGNYPEYDDEPGAGAVPAAPADPAAAEAAGWQPVAETVGASHVDHPAGRDQWFYVAFARNDCGLVSPPSGPTPGALNYLLGDVAGGAAPGEGDNRIDILDVTALGDAYGVADGHDAYRNWLDVGPTEDFSTFGRPLTDDVIDFEDLIIMAIGFGTAGKSGAPELATAGANALTLDAPPLPGVGEELVVGLRLAGDGRVQGLSIPLTWDDRVLAWAGCEPGELLERQGGLAVVLAPRPGVIDVALIGRRDVGLAGEGELARVRLRVLAAGDPALALGAVTARSPGNEPIALGAVVATELPTATALRSCAPNPFNPTTTIAFDLARPGRARLRVFGVDGRTVRVLLDEDRAAGRHAVAWDGTDGAGRRAAAGTYVVRFEAGGVVQSRKLMLVK